MRRLVIGDDVALHLATRRSKISANSSLVAPTLLRSQVLARLYLAVRRGELARAAADTQLDYLRGLRIRLLGDRVLQRVAWKIAERLDWPNTYAAEYLAATQLQADAFVTLDVELKRAAQALVPIASLDDLIARTD